MTDVNKAIKPVESLIIAPLNEGANYQANNYILFRIGASNLNMWLTNASYLTFDLECKEKAVVTGYKNTETQEVVCPSYIKNACNIFSQVEVVYGGDTIYSQPYNIEQNTLKQLYLGEEYMQGNYATYTTREMVMKDQNEKGADHLEDGIYSYLKLSNNNCTNPDDEDDLVAGSRKATTIRNVMVPINQLIPLFMDMGSEGFPVRCLKEQIEIRLYIAEPYRYIVDWNPVIQDFDYRLWEGDTTRGMVHSNFFAATVKDRYASDDIKLTNVKMYCQHYLPDASLAARIDNDALNSPEGMNWQFVRTEIAMRQVNQINKTNNLPFTAATENTNSLMFYCYRTGYSPGLMYRPNINSLYISFGSNQLPFQPIPGNTYSAPFEYRFPTDDVLHNIDTYFSLRNHDFLDSYRFIEDTTTLPNTRAITVPTSSFVLMGSNYCSDPSSLGSQSSQWNSQYQAHFNAPYIDKAQITGLNDDGDDFADKDGNGLTFVLGVESKWGFTLQNGKLSTLNI